jgi:hypothetical protein
VDVWSRLDMAGLPVGILNMNGAIAEKHPGKGKDVETCRQIPTLGASLSGP